MKTVTSFIFEKVDSIEADEVKGAVCILFESGRILEIAGNFGDELLEAYEIYPAVAESREAIEL